ncbi:MAG: MFS transporter [Oscillospiraceae bacterium]|jgi:Na+/melibiose symporter-like transporter|nr:MFS transporter [Oscillospiraceae bacterium]
MAAEKTKAAGKLKLDYKKTILTGFGFLGTCVAWAIYDPYITKILDKLLSASSVVTGWSSRLERIEMLSRFMDAQGQKSQYAAAGAFTIVPLLIGVIMTFDNIFGVIFQPTFGKLSDRWQSRLGKRRPFLLFGAPLSALLFALIPWMNGLPATMVCIILFVFVMSLWRAPVVALMPDLTPPELRSQGNGVINFMGAVGSGVGMAAGMVVSAIYLKLKGLPGDYFKENISEEFAVFPYVFLIGSVVMIIGMLVVMLKVKEKDSRLISSEVIPAREDKVAEKAAKEAKKAEKQTGGMKALAHGERRSLLFMLAGLFFLFCGVNAITTFFALFAEEILHLNTGAATMRLLVLAVVSVLAAIPAGNLGKRFGRKKMILAGLALFAAGLVVFLLSLLSLVKANGLTLDAFLYGNEPAAQNVTKALNGLMFPVLALAGFANMLITVNTLPLVLEIGGLAKVGTFTGYYYTATFSAQIASPIVYAFVRIFSGTYLSLFYYSPVAFVLAIAAILFVRHGEAIPEAVIKEAEDAG